MIRVVLADDQPVVRRGIAVFLEKEGDITVVGEASTGPEAVEQARRLRPDVVLVDVRMPEGDGLTATAELTAGTRDDPLPVIVVTTFDVDDYAYAAFDNGASGFVLKDAHPDEFVRAVRSVAAGGVYLSPAVAPRLVGEFARRRPRSTPEDGPAGGADVLSPREVDIVRALCGGMSNSEIATALGLEVSTVKSHLGRVAAKLGVRDRVQIVVWAFQHGAA